MAEYIKGDVITEEGRTAEFQRDTGIPCPACGHGATPRTMWVRDIVENTATIECKSCGNIMHVPKERVEQRYDLQGRPIPMPK